MNGPTAERTAVAHLPGVNPVLVRWLPATILTLLDAALTFVWLELGVAAEANPWLAGIVETSGPASAMAVRAGVGTALVAFLAILATEHRSARAGLVAVTGVLTLVVGWHIAGGAMVASTL